MKILLVLLLAGGASHAQELMGPLPVDATSRLITYTAVVPTPGVTQADLLARARVWANGVGVPAKPVLVVSEMGTDVLVVAGSQAISATYSVAAERLYFLARVARREGHYQYRFEEHTLESPTNSGGTTYDPAEKVLLQSVPPRASGNSAATRQRRAFEEAAGQVAAALQAALTTALADGTGT